MKKPIRFTALAVLIVLLASMLPMTATAAKGMTDTSKVFEDVSPRAWYKNAVDYAVTHGMFTGTSKTTFEPETKVDRAMFVTVLARLDGAKVNSDRTRLPRENDLIVGDVLLVKFMSGEAMYLYVGEGKFINLNTLKDDTFTASARLARMPSAYNYFVILRPSFGL